jgi:hypothetical protein
MSNMEWEESEAWEIGNMNVEIWVEMEWNEWKCWGVKIRRCECEYVLYL